MHCCVTEVAKVRPNYGANVDLNVDVCVYWWTLHYLYSLPKSILYGSRLLASVVTFFTTALKNQLHYEAYQQALKEGVKISLKYVKFLVLALHKQEKHP